MGDININLLKKNNNLNEILTCFGLTNIVKGATCFKNPNNPSLLDVILCTSPRTIADSLNINIGISDFHNFTCAASKIEVSTINKTRIQYRSYKNFDEEHFRYDISCRLSKINDSAGENEECNNEEITKTVMYEIQETLNKHAPIKVKYIKSNQVPYMHGKLRKAINVKNMLFRKHIKCPNENTWNEYKTQRNYVTTLKKTSLRNYFETKCEQGGKNKSFWEIIKPYFSNKTYTSSKINLLDNGCLVTDTKEVCELFNDFFVNIASADTSSKIDHITDFTNHKSIEAIRSAYPCSNPFNFRVVSQSEVLKKLFKLNTRKAQGYDQIPPYILKVAANEISHHITNIINNSFTSCSFPNALKYADVSPIFKKLDILTRNNYRPISVLTTISKIFESIVSDQMNDFFGNILSSLLSAYRAKYSSNNVLLLFVENIRKALDNNHHVGCILMDLSKAFDCLNHKLLLAKLQAYGVSPEACLFLNSYLSNRKQRVKIQNHYSSWKDLKIGVPQGSILGPLLFNIFINDIFLAINPNVELYNYADDNTLVFSHPNKDVMKTTLESASKQAIEWFSLNGMKANPNKFQALYLNKRHTSDATFNIEQSVISPEESVKLLGVEFDNDLSFNNHVNNICSKASKQINALRRISHLLTKDSKLTIYNSFINSTLNYCPIVYNTFTKTSFQQLEKIQKRALRLVYNDFTSSYKTILSQSNKPSIGILRMQQTAIQVFKILKGLSPPIPATYFEPHVKRYDTRSINNLILPRYHNIKYGKHSFKYMGAFIWNSLPNNLKSIENLADFKKQIKDWSGPECQCNSCFWCNLKHM
jgi:hypothetical protein